jgi:hypothetical protein
MLRKYEQKRTNKLINMKVQVHTTIIVTNTSSATSVSSILVTEEYFHKVGSTALCQTSMSNTLL